MFVTDINIMRYTLLLLYGERANHNEYVFDPSKRNIFD